MFHSFFPNPKLFFPSALLWTIVVVAIWYTVGADIGAQFGLPQLGPGQEPPIGLGHFFTTASIWFYIYFISSMVLFCLF